MRERRERKAWKRTLAVSYFQTVPSSLDACGVDVKTPNVLRTLLALSLAEDHNTHQDKGRKTLFWRDSWTGPPFPPPPGAIVSPWTSGDFSRLTQMFMLSPSLRRFLWVSVSSGFKVNFGPFLCPRQTCPIFQILFPGQRRQRHRGSSSPPSYNHKEGGGGGC